MKKYRKPKSIIWDKASYYCVKICPRCELVRLRAEDFVIKNYSSAVLCTRLHNVFFRGCPLSTDDALFIDYVRQQSNFYDDDLPW